MHHKHMFIKKMFVVHFQCTGFLQYIVSSLAECRMCMSEKFIDKIHIGGHKKIIFCLIWVGASSVDYSNSQCIVGFCFSLSKVGAIKKMAVYFILNVDHKRIDDANLD